jgi:hypothetical protein
MKLATVIFPVYYFEALNLRIELKVHWVVKKVGDTYRCSTLVQKLLAFPSFLFLLLFLSSTVLGCLYGQVVPKSSSDNFHWIGILFDTHLVPYSQHFIFLQLMNLLNKLECLSLASLSSPM